MTSLAPIDKLGRFDRFNKMMEDMFQGWSKVWSPVVDIKETDKDLTFVCELPGLNEKDVEVEVRENMLTISGKREFHEKETKEDYIRIERSYGAFQRTFSLEAPVKPDMVEAKFKDGLLTVVVPKVELPQPKKIPVLRG